ncbi:adenosylcobinamide-GDP ribazoletransferase [Rubellimicrobium rubrum]|uniref:Adenosylcobinamide-GDP ribazoletransferase n=1 Tax=Rubellimicrobium rubrum TaxID=2585369 RepID=A0A5C4MVW2_9RHOB|nr:adenosylcobinamide-GDP ribazoletransferase [Rubellimicrobium rubrum]TNC48008.1 adenosylcobinamide-GDP ribazoletransferase [Rubellimicrobium rubrum]
MPYSELVRRSDVAEALMLLSRLPAPWQIQPRGAASAWAWPVVGGLMGLLSAGVAIGSVRAGLPTGAAAGLALAAQAILTGGLHEDGLADSADGLWGGGTTERRLEIMKDSRIGSYGALALILSVLLRWSALSAILASGSAWGPIIAIGALSRWPMVAMLWALPAAREGGLSRLVGRPNGTTLALTAAVALGLAGAAQGGALKAALTILIVTVVWTLIVRRRLGGQTGDTCGAAQQLAEAAALLALAAQG